MPTCDTPAPYIRRYHACNTSLLPTFGGERCDQTRSPSIATAHGGLGGLGPEWSWPGLRDRLRNINHQRWSRWCRWTGSRASFVAQESLGDARAPSSRRRYEMARLQEAVVIPCARSMFAGSALRLCVQHVPALRGRRRRNRRVDFFDLSHSSISAECLCKKVRTRMEHQSG